MGSVRYLHMTLLLATYNAILHLLIGYLVAHNPQHFLDGFQDTCCKLFLGWFLGYLLQVTSWMVSRILVASYC
jgi:hypothetical protein